MRPNRRALLNIYPNGATMVVNNSRRSSAAAAAAAQRRHMEPPELPMLHVSQSELKEEERGDSLSAGVVKSRSTSAHLTALLVPAGGGGCWV